MCQTRRFFPQKKPAHTHTHTHRQTQKQVQSGRGRGVSAAFPLSGSSDGPSGSAKLVVVTVASFLAQISLFDENTWKYFDGCRWWIGRATNGGEFSRVPSTVDLGRFRSFVFLLP